MHQWSDLNQVPEGFGPCVVTIGNFDGVHRGHRNVLARTVATAHAIGGASIVITFDPHPAAVHQPETAQPLITGLTDRLELLGLAGVDAVLVVSYTLEFAKATAEEFVRTYLVDGLEARVIVVGGDVRFGAENHGDLATMRVLGTKYGFHVQTVEDVAGEQGRRWSSTWVRELLAAGDVDGAAVILGRPHRMRGVVVRGDDRGRGLGFPTANLGPDATGFVPADGVYAGWMRRVHHPADSPDGYLPVAISVGTNPTFGGTDRRVEAHVPDRSDLSLLGEEVVLEFTSYLRPMARFTSVDELVAQVTQDVARVHALLAGGPLVLGRSSDD